MDPGVPLNGRRVGSNFASGSRVYFVCRDGYNTVGAKVLLCQDNGIWDSATPTCSPANSKRVMYCTSPKLLTSLIIPVLEVYVLDI